MNLDCQTDSVIPNKRRQHYKKPHLIRWHVLSTEYFYRKLYSRIYTVKSQVYKAKFIQTTQTHTNENGLTEPWPARWRFLCPRISPSNHRHSWPSSTVGSDWSGDHEPTGHVHYQYSRPACNTV